MAASTARSRGAAVVLTARTSRRAAEAISVTPRSKASSFAFEGFVELVALREREGLSRKDFAARIGATQPYIAKLESGRVQNLGLKTLAKYAAATGTRLTVSFEPVSHHRKPAAKRQGSTVRVRTTRRTVWVELVQIELSN